jgi:hypothetical protein
MFDRSKRVARLPLPPLFAGRLAGVEYKGSPGCEVGGNGVADGPLVLKLWSTYTNDRPALHSFLYDPTIYLSDTRVRCTALTQRQ